MELHKTDADFQRRQPCSSGCLLPITTMVAPTLTSGDGQIIKKAALMLVIWWFWMVSQATDERWWRCSGLEWLCGSWNCRFWINVASAMEARNKITSLYFTLLYFTRTLPALLQILALMFAVTSGKVPNVTRSHDRVTRLLEVQVVVRLPRYCSHSTRSPWDFSAAASQNCSSWPHTTNSTAVPSPPYP